MAQDHIDHLRKADFVAFITSERKRLGELASKGNMSAQQ